MAFTESMDRWAKAVEKAAKNDPKAVAEALSAEIVEAWGEFFTYFEGMRKKAQPFQGIIDVGRDVGRVDLSNRSQKITFSISRPGPNLNSSNRSVKKIAFDFTKSSAKTDDKGFVAHAGRPNGLYGIDDIPTISYSLQEEFEKFLASDLVD